MELSEYTTEQLQAELRRRQQAVSLEKRRKRERKLYQDNREKRIAYQRDYYQRNREKILNDVRQKRLKAKIDLPVMVDKQAKRKEIAHNWYLRNREKQLADVKRRYWEKKQEKVSAAVVGQ